MINSVAGAGGVNPSPDDSEQMPTQSSQYDDRFKNAYKKDDEQQRDSSSDEDNENTTEQSAGTGQRTSPLGDAGKLASKNNQGNGQGNTEAEKARVKTKRQEALRIASAYVKGEIRKLKTGEQAETPGAAGLVAGGSSSFAINAALNAGNPIGKAGGIDNAKIEQLLETIAAHALELLAGKDNGKIRVDVTLKGEVDGMPREFAGAKMTVIRSVDGTMRAEFMLQDGKDPIKAAEMISKNLETLATAMSAKGVNLTEVKVGTQVINVMGPPPQSLPKPESLAQGRSDDQGGGQQQQQQDRGDQQREGQRQSQRTKDWEELYKDNKE